MELLVVIAIIAILASVILASLSGTETKARDAKRMEEVSSLQKAIALYLVSHGSYPIVTSTTTLTGTDPLTSALIAEGDIPSAPIDPSSPVYNYTYVSNALGNNYWIGFCLETNQIPNYIQGCGNTVSP
jgi:type II secretory pathway pseudopilin PulG